ncbi:MAG: hypothetical protein ACE1ZE_07455, partial [Candidatus Binatia bacterium]
MSAGNNLLKFMGLAGMILLLLGQGCSQKLTQMIADSESLESMGPNQGFSSEHPGGNKYFAVGDSAGNPNSGDWIQGGPIEQARQHMSDPQSAQGLGPLAFFQDGGFGGDAGLEHLKGLTSLEALHLHFTQVTAAGVAKLQQALPNCMIY